MSQTQSSPTVIQWVIDTRPLWPSALKTKDLTTSASRALSLLAAEEQAAVLRYYHVRDAKLALASALLKRYVISRFCQVPWSEAKSTRDARTKPVFISPSGDEPLIFNISHQAGLAVLLAVHNPPEGLAVGVDVVCPPERRDRDLRSLADEGWPSFVDMHADVFGAGEVAALKHMNPGSAISERDHALRYFYALWCLREAYVKMTGDALLASWLKDLEMRDFAPPEDMQKVQEAWLRGRRVEGVDLKLMPFSREYMISTAVSHKLDGETVELKDFQTLDVEEVLAFGEKLPSS
ncbi:null pigmentation protein npga [Fusarium sporotrichioides]|uniref:holo-[acyl-carrier-protein] synthase n=1 Tax=Fusarium sporotrichioides TaxID=5514 RepID=A0A395RFC1_FUSSP|nr:null pigmentation protein npga [Fusarium sporotrichioides]